MNVEDQPTMSIPTDVMLQHSVGRPPAPVCRLVEDARGNFCEGPQMNFPRS